MSLPDPAIAAPKKLMTLDEYWEFVHRPENDDRFFELRRGEVIELSRPKTPHGIVCARVTTKLQNYADAVERGHVTSNDAGVILSESPGTVVGPDAAYFALTIAFDDVVPKWADVPPVLAVEVLSPNDKPSEVNEKIEDYLRGGVRVVWLMDPEQKKVTVFRPDRTHTVLKGEAELSGGEELPGFTCKILDFFRTPGERPKPLPPPPAA